MSKSKINFEDAHIGSDNYKLLANGYHGLDWDNFYVVDYARKYPATGYGPGTTSGHQAGANGSGDPATVSLPGGSFNVKSVELTAAYDSTLLVEITGYRNGMETYDKQFNLTDSAPMKASLNFKHIDELTFTSVDGTHDTSLPPAQSGDHMVIDDLAISKIRPPSGDLALAFSGAELLQGSHSPQMHADLFHPTILAVV